MTITCISFKPDIVLDEHEKWRFANAMLVEEGKPLTDKYSSIEVIVPDEAGATGVIYPVNEPLLDNNTLRVLVGYIPQLPDGTVANRKTYSEGDKYVHQLYIHNNDVVVALMNETDHDVIPIRSNGHKVADFFRKYNTIYIYPNIATGEHFLKQRISEYDEEILRYIFKELGELLKTENIPEGFSFINIDNKAFKYYVSNMLKQEGFKTGCVIWLDHNYLTVKELKEKVKDILGDEEYDIVIVTGAEIIRPYMEMCTSVYSTSSLFGHSIYKGFLVPVWQVLDEEEKNRILFYQHKQEKRPVGEVLEQDNIILTYPDLYKGYHFEPTKTYGREVNVLRRIIACWRKWKTGERIVKLDVAQTALQLIENISKQKKNELEGTICDYENAIKTRITQIARYTKELEIARKELQAIDQLMEEQKEKLLQEFKNIRNLNNIKDIEIKDSNLIVYTDKIYAKVTKEPYEGRYFLGMYKIIINLDNGKIEFFNIIPDCRRRSYWTENDQHPHIASDGEACFGDAYTPIAEFFSQREYCAMVTLLVSFLQSVNVDDVAGKCVLNWDKVNEEGEVIEKGYRDKHYSVIEEEIEGIECPYCGAIVPRDEAVDCANCGERACQDCATYITEPYDRSVCPDCLDENFTLCSICGEYFDYDDGVSVNGEHVCRWCYHAEYVQCSECGEDIHRDYYAHECEICGENVCFDCTIHIKDDSGVVHNVCSHECRDDLINDDRESFTNYLEEARADV